ncbi:MAG TPA: hypothetical protein VH475_23050 [Tepidisphaeraceae bacterium]|jgi:hypothetical protein
MSRAIFPLMLPLLCATLALSALGEARAPAKPAAAAAATAGDPAWTTAVERFATALVGGDDHTIESMLTLRASVRRFDGTRNDETWRLFERVMNSTLVGQHAYLHPPLVMAADIAADFKNAPAVPAKARTRFVVDDDDEIKRANTTAVQWIEEQLKAAKGTPVGVIVLWTPRPTTPGSKPSAPVVYDPVFILLRGEAPSGSSKQYKVSTVLYGLPVPEPTDGPR